MNLIGFDIETQGDGPTWALEPFRALTGGARLSSMAWVPEGADFEAAQAEPCVEAWPTPSSIAAWLQRAIDERAWICVWNASFDPAWLIALGLRDLVGQARWLDGSLLWKHCVQTPTFYTGPGARFTFGLKEAVAEVWPDYAGYGDGIDFEDNSPEAVRRRLRYNGMDAWFTVQLCRHFLDQLPEKSRRNALIEAQCIPLVAGTVVDGIRGNRQRSVVLAQKLRTIADETLLDLQQSDPTITPEVLSSSVQLRGKVYDEWGLPAARFTKTGAPSTDRTALVDLAAADDRAMKLNAFREASNNLTKFAIGMQRSLDYNGDGYTRPTPRIYGTYTGRMTFSSKVGRGKLEQPIGVPIHQWKRDPEYRDAVDPPEGFDLCEFDFAGQEFRWMAIESGDPTMLGLCQPGEDPHSFMGASIAHMDYHDLMRAIHDGDKTAKPKRQAGKVGNLSLQYRTSAKRLRSVAKVQYNLLLSDEEAQDIWSIYRRSYPGVPRYWTRQIQFVRRNRYVETIAGRRVFVPDITPATKWSAESTAINFPIQGIGADQKYLALLLCKPLLVEYGARFYFELHDGLFFVCPKRHTQVFASRMKSVLSNLPYERAWGFKSPIPLPVDAKTGPSWGALKDFEG